MKKKPFSYFITPFGVISFTLKYVFINGKKTKSVFRLLQLLKKFNENLFSVNNMFIFYVYDYKSLHGILHCYLLFGCDSWRITRVYDSFVHKASEIFHGQYSIYVYKTINDSCFIGFDYVSTCLL